MPGDFESLQREDHGEQQMPKTQEVHPEILRLGQRRLPNLKLVIFKFLYF